MGRGPQVTAVGWVQPPAVLNDTQSHYGCHTCCGLYLCERWGSVHRPDHQEGNKTQHKQQKLKSLWRHRCCCSHVGNCAAVRDHVHSRRVSCASAQQRHCTAGISISRLHEEVSIIYILTADLILSRPKVVAILSEASLRLTGWLCWFECSLFVSRNRRVLPESLPVQGCIWHISVGVYCPWSDTAQLSYE